MADCIGQASFKNSRSFPRPATITAVVNALGVAGAPVTLAPATSMTIPANPNRTYLTIRNENTDVPPAGALRYNYDGGVSGFVIFPKESVDIDYKGAVTINNVSLVAVTVDTDEGSG